MVPTVGADAEKADRRSFIRCGRWQGAAARVRCTTKYIFVPPDTCMRGLVCDNCCNAARVLRGNSYHYYGLLQPEFVMRKGLDRIRSRFLTYGWGACMISPPPQHGLYACLTYRSTGTGASVTVRTARQTNPPERATINCKAVNPRRHLKYLFPGLLQALRGLPCSGQPRGWTCIVIQFARIVARDLDIKYFEDSAEDSAAGMNAIGVETQLGCCERAEGSEAGLLNMHSGNRLPECINDDIIVSLDPSTETLTGRTKNLMESG
jgi:hypothetical protein